MADNPAAVAGQGTAWRETYAYFPEPSMSHPAPIDATTRYCAVYGHPVKHSASPAFQNAGIAALGLNWKYLAFDVRPEELRQAIEGARAMRFIGVNLTVPHKLLAMDMVEVLDESARTWGAINTIRFEARDAAGVWRPLREYPMDQVPETVRAHGFNTDAGAVIQSIREDLGISVAGTRVLLLGAGGAGRMAALKLAHEGVAALHLVNRTRGKAEQVMAEVRERYPNVQASTSYPAGPVDLILNATSLGLKPSDPMPLIPADYNLGRAAAVYDMIYRPAETPLLRAAREAGCRVANGVGMLLYQGAKALEIWTGQAPPIPQMREALLRNVYV